MKKWLSLLMILPVVFMSACAVAQVSYRLSDDCSINTEYVVGLRPGDTDAAQYTDAIMQYWIEKGFTPALTENDDALTITGKKNEAYDSPAAAANAFALLLTDEDSLFEDAQFVYTPSHDYDEYSLKATVSLQGIIRQNEPQSIPEGEIDRLESDAADGTYTLSIALPGEIVSTNADSTQNGVCTWKLTYGSVTEIELKTSKLNRENIEEYAALTEQQHRDNILLLACGAATVLLIVALIIVTVIRNRKNRPSKVHVKKL